MFQCQKTCLPRCVEETENTFAKMCVFQFKSQKKHVCQDVHVSTEESENMFAKMFGVDSLHWVSEAHAALFFQHLLCSLNQGLFSLFLKPSGCGC